MLHVNIDQKSYKEKKVLKNINFCVDDRELIAVVAPSGTGKTSLLNCMLEYTNYQGRVWDDNDVGGKVVSVQQQDTLNEREKVWQALYYTAKLDYKRVPDKEIQLIVERTMKALGILHLRDMPISQISGGQSRRTQLAEGLVRRSSLLLLDEPTTGLDAWSSYRLIQDLQRVVRAEKKKVIVVSHDITPQTLSLYSKILVLAKDKDGVASIGYYGTYQRMYDYFEESSVLAILEKISSKEEGRGEGYKYINKFRDSDTYRSTIRMQDVIRNDGGEFECLAG